MRTYLDHAATTPIRPEAQAALVSAMERWANPSSPHANGRAARAMLEDARRRIKAAFGWKGELIFTSGASEAQHIALGRTDARVLASAVEHDAVYRAVPGAKILSVDSGGRLRFDMLEEALTGADAPLVAVQHVNSETGFIQPVEEVAQLVRSAGGRLVCDCAQSAGKLPLPDADMIVVSAHKFGGPPGIGALLVRNLGMLKASGGQEFGYRAGTQNVPAAMGFAAALEAITRKDDGRADWLMKLEPHIAEMRKAIEALGGMFQPAGVDDGADPLASIMAVTIPGLSAAAQLVQFDLAGIAVSAGSACSSGSMKPSRTLLASGVPEALAACTIRVSLGWTTTPADLDRFVGQWSKLARGAAARAA